MKPPYIRQCQSWGLGICKVLIAFLSVLFFSCSQPIEIIWETTDNGYLLWTRHIDGASYSWSGDVFDSVIHGKGILTTTLSDGKSTSESIVAYYGAKSKNYTHNVTANEAFNGAISNSRYDGFGCLIKGTEIYVGNFLAGKPDGQLRLYRNGKLFYTGSWSNGKFNGGGTLTREDGSVKSGIWENGNLISAEVSVDTKAGKYEGLVKNGKPNGYGRLAYKNNTEYEGDWKDGVWNGIGQYIVVNDTITSEWKNGVAEGNTQMVLGDYQYDGQCKNNLPDGQGSFYSTNPDVQYLYAGEWVGGKRQGYGDTVYPNGDAYYGEWLNDEYSGIGRYRFANGDSYDGEWKNNLPDGKGKYVAESFTYAGDWLKGWIHGTGRLDYSNGDTYEGDFCEGQKCGQGAYFFANGNTYEGEFYNDKINGLGVFTFTDGNRYEGEFSDGKIYGNGTLYYSDTTGVVTITAFWDKPNEFPSKASIIFPNGDAYEGPLLNGEPTSAGFWYHIDEETDEASVVDKLSDANELYKKHRKTWNKVVMFTSLALTAVEIGATLAVPLTAGASLAIAGAAASVAHFANTALNVVDIGLSLSSASIDVANADTKAEKKAAIINLGSEVAMNAALIALPAVLKSGPVKKLSSSALKAVKKPLMTFSRTAPVKKVIGVVKNAEGKFVTELRSSFQKTKIYRHIKRITGRASDQYITNEQVQKLIKKHPEKAPKYDPNSIASGDKLGNNMRNVMSERAKKRFDIEHKILGGRRAQYHHVVAGNSPSAERAREILKKFKIDINDPRNGILLPMKPESIMKGTLHKSHLAPYDETVYKRLLMAKTQDQALEILDDIKKELYKGQLRLTNNHAVNTALGTVIRNTTK